MVDLHNDALLSLPANELLPYLREAKSAGVDEIWLSVWTSHLTHPLTVIKNKKKILDQIQGDPTYPVCRLHIEDAWFLTDKNLDKFLALRPHSVGLTWNNSNRLAGGAHGQGGITAFGREVIRRLESAGIQIDTAHLNRTSFFEFAQITTRPLVCTHTAFDAVCHHPRNLTKQQIKTIIQSGGMIGLCLVPQFLAKNTISCGINDLLNHISCFHKHFPNTELHWGTDFYGTDFLPFGITNYRDLCHLFDVQIIGYSALHQPILAYHFGKPDATQRLLVTGGMHAREWLTTNLVQELMLHYTDLPNHVSITYVPNCNPDGTRLAQTGLTSFFQRHAKRLKRINHNNVDFRLWKANARAVDLNVNFDAGWSQGATNITTPAPANYIGRKPNSEPETRALLKLIKQYQPTISLAFHSKGEIVYYSRPADRPTAEKLANLTQYRAELSIKSYGGLTDYLALKCGVPSFTIEVGNDALKHPLTAEYLPEIYERTKDVLRLFF